MIWDVHCHFPRNFENPDDTEYEKALDARADALRAAGVTRASLLCGGRLGITHDQAIELSRRHEDLFVPCASIDPGEAQGREIRRLHELGYRGLKIIGTSLPYDDYRYFSTYDAAEALAMPIVFHLGVIGGGIDYSVTHPRYDAEAAARLVRAREFIRRGPRDVSAIRMRPFHLDTIANNFPELHIIGAHMGGTGNYDEAASVARWRHRFYLDLSGGDTIERHAVERGLVGKEIGVEKLTWGSDCGDDEIAEHLERLEQIFVQAGLTEEQADRIRYRNAAEMFGEAEPVLAGE